MRNYYELEEDLYLEGRWQLAGPIDDEDRDPREFSYGKSMQLRGPLIAHIHTPGKPLDFTQTVSMAPIFSRLLADVIRPLVKEHAQMVPVHLNGFEGFEVLIAGVLLPCIDDNRSEFMKWTEKDGRPELVGHYRMVTKLMLDPGKIPSNLHIFRPMFWEMPLIVSQAFVDTILPLNPTGVKLKLVT